VDEIAPVITLTGEATVTIEVGTAFTDAGATASDNYDGDISASIVAISTVDTDVVGSYAVTYNVTDTNVNNAVTVTRTINVVDTTIPVITLTGDAPVTVEFGDTYTDAGATASDNYDGDITSSIVTVNPVDETTVGTYIVTYNVTDANGNAAVEVTRTVNVIDTTIPVITLTGDAPVAVEFGDTYTDAGATASDNYDGDITANILALSTVDIDVVGSYMVTYDITDANGNSAVTVTRTINVVDTTIPVITLTGDATVTIEVGTTYTDADAIASDNYDGDISADTVAVSTVDTDVVGSYTVTYNVTDANGNTAVTVTRTINVVDTTIPVITLTGEATVTIEVGSTYTDADATASDNYDGDITANIVAVSTYIDIIGSYTVTYDVTDTNGNIAITVTRTVNIIDTDIDGDGIGDTEDTDIDGDGIENEADADINGDGILDNGTDNDEDGINDGYDTDDDNDGYADLDEIICGTNPLDDNDIPADNDNDGLADLIDSDDDDDSVLDENDNCPLTYNPFQEDRDNDGKGDVCDLQEVNISQAITPNGDGINDTWMIYNIENHPNNKASVYNRWGKLVYSKKRYVNDWDGSYEGNRSRNLPAAPSYYYQLDLDGDGIVDYSGWLYITK
jgi:gliding motility-associated-like protein